jgi:hypothetical protein
MARSRVFAIAAASALALVACGGESAYPGFAATGSGVETVNDAAAIAAHRPTGSQYSAAAIGAVDAVGSLIKELPALDGQPSRGRGCHDGSEFFTPSRIGDPHSTESREFFDASCTHIALDAIRVFKPTGPHSENETVAVSIYAPKSPVPIAFRLENSQVTNANFDRLGYATTRDGFVRTTTRQLLISNQRRSVSSSETVMMPSISDDLTKLCQNFAGYDAAGIPSLDATFGWQGATIGSPAPIRSADTNGIVTVSTTEVGSAVTGPVGSLSLLTSTAHAGCPDAAAAYALSGGTTASTYSIPLRAEYRNDRLLSLAVTRASFAGGYTFDVETTRNPRSGAIAVNGLMLNGEVRIAGVHADAFGNGGLAITSTGAQYRLVDWTVVL